MSTSTTYALIAIKISLLIYYVYNCIYTILSMQSTIVDIKITI